MQSGANPSPGEIPCSQGNLQGIGQNRRTAAGISLAFSNVWRRFPCPESREFFALEQGKFLPFAGNSVNNL
jgi:hypothetical protein